MISLLVAMDRNHVIGFENDMPWHIPNDLKFFKNKTNGHSIVMGRKTFESLGRVLPNREHIVLSRSQISLPEEVKLINDLKVVLEWNEENPDKEIFIIGGGDIYKQMLPFADRMYITSINESFKGDTFFPRFNESDWKLTSKEKGIKDDKNPYDYYFLQYNREF